MVVQAIEKLRNGLGEIVNDLVKARQAKPRGGTKQTQLIALFETLTDVSLE